jgi:hypothetical protein
MIQNKPEELCPEICDELDRDPTLNIYGTKWLKRSDPFASSRMMFFLYMDAIEHAMRFFEQYEPSPTFPRYERMLSSELVPIIKSFENWKGDPITEGIVILAGRITAFPNRRVKSAPHSVMFGMVRCS